MPKRLLTLLLLSSLACHSFTYAMTVSRAEPSSYQITSSETDPSLEALIVQVREKLAVHELLDQFSVNSWQYEDMLSYNFRWWSQEREDYIYVTLEANGTIRDINCYSASTFATNDRRPHFPMYSEIEAVAKATAWVERIYPERAEQVRVTQIAYNSYSGYMISFGQYIREIPVLGNYITIYIDKDSGDLRNLYSYWTNFDSSTLGDSYGVLTAAELQEYLRQELGLKLQYSPNYNSSYYTSSFYLPDGRQQPEILLEYAWGNAPSEYIDAYSGKFYNPPRYDQYYQGRGGGGGTADSYGISASPRALREELTLQEMQRIEELEGLISTEKAISLLFALPYLDLPQDLILTQASYSSGYELPKREVLNLYFSNPPDSREYAWAYANLDAKSGELLSFSCSSNRLYPKEPEVLTKTTWEEAIAAADTFLQTVKPTYFQQTQRMSLPDFSAYDTYNYGYDHLTLTYQRIVNGLVYTGNSCSVSINAANGKVSDYYQNWNSELVFPSPEPSLPADTAYESIFQAVPLSLAILPVPVSEGGEQFLTTSPAAYAAKLVYPIGELVFNTTLDAHAGTVYPQPNQVRGQRLGGAPSFSDLAGDQDASRLEAVAMMLPWEGGEFNPEEHLTQYAYLKLLYSLFENYGFDGTEREFYQYMVGQGYLAEEDMAPTRLLTAMDEVKYLVNFIYLGQYVTNMPGIFVNPLGLPLQEAAIVALAVGNKAITFNTFEPQALLTKRAAFLTLYNYLAR